MAEVRAGTLSGIVLAAALIAGAAIVTTVTAARAEMITLSTTQLDAITAAGVTDQQGTIWYHDGDFRRIWRKWRRWQRRLARAHSLGKRGRGAQARIERMLHGTHGMAIAAAHAQGATTWVTVQVALRAGSSRSSSYSSSTSRR